MTQEKRVALVTGASRGIGRAIAHELGRQGRIVIGTATSPAGAENIDADLKANGIEGAGMCLNVTDQASIDEVLKTIGERFGAPTILVNNAGITRDNLLMRMKEEEWDSVMDTNLKSVYRVSKACLRGMTKARFGRIVSISSVVATMGNLGQANYAAAKAGMEGFSRALAREVASRAITVNAVAPGFIATDMTEALPEAQHEMLLKQIPLARLGGPEEIAAAVGFLTSDAAGYITGETLHVNGGMNMR
ncbi:3-oxoacyl-ACP reductase FabG [Halomonas sp. CnH100-B]|uniref:3-oxoacyl-[acyl-carrier-protein] reductase n=1 Tax=Vreelandella aquamarina TaxID=77097 RepID=A0A857GLS5_9GAMM|nr:MULTISPECIES: 3-oxoacyl-ACP reductase FabG [Halomonas]MAO63334.1 3-oxoacyl-ACP reductase [Halomonas sp.]MCO7227914.1 3-oxoacyl-ACP reductase FabG [Halomonas sp. CnH100-B]MDK9687358.1 3-oxoacyl-ACP reductase FabG [Halomonas sp. LC1]MDP4556433.1 3-oxoacyl-ACP reductase FabG [Halomonas meridiana]QHD50219.1 3-oxoacyl-ACP reductase [Halomonas meridiana]|tara:strand:+ start:2398 stop:3141 length:744 start_codon:yes stop_codon:yes gene_type:complete